jgi:hypothetical protein
MPTWKGEGSAKPTLPHSGRRSVWAIRATAARHGFYALDLIAHDIVEDGVGQKDQPVRAGVRVVILTRGCYELD